VSEHIGPGKLSELSDIFKTRGIRSCFLVADPVAYVSSGASEVIKPLLDTLETLTIFSDFSPNPDDLSVEKALGCATRQSYDAVLAVGGGTAIDIAKLVSCSLTSGLAEIISIPEGIIRNNLLIAVPTTAGTGSEATHFAVLYVDGVKHSIAHNRLLPDISIVDSNLLQSIPPSVAAHTGLDAFCQSIESLWSVQSTAASREFALQGLKLSFTNLERFVDSPDPGSRDAMARAAHFSGKAINISKTTAPHAISYTLTSKSGIPHGLAVAMTIGPCLAWNADVTEEDCIDPRGVAHAQKSMAQILEVLSSSSPTQAVDRIDALLVSIECHPRLSDNGIETADLDAITATVNAERLANNPRRLDSNDIRSLLQSRL
jgi:alcohol dehydrogenase class IV